MDYPKLNMLRVAAGFVLLLQAGCASNQNAAPETAADRAIAVSYATRSVPGHEAGGRATLDVDGKPLTIPEVLYPLRTRIESVRANRPQAAQTALVTQWVRAQTQQDVGTILLYKQATADWGKPQQQAIDRFIDQRLRTHVAEHFGGSQARFERHLEDYGLTLDKYRLNAKRAAVARNYAREEFMPMVHVRRDELMDLYERRYASRPDQPALRELFMIEVPYAEFLPTGTTWSEASATQKEAARTAAQSRIVQAQSRLRDEPFAAVAREYSYGLMAAAGGAWGAVGRPLQPPRDVPSQRVFALEPQEISEIIETDDALYIVKCGAIDAPQRPNFVDVQGELKQELLDARISKLSEEHMEALVAEASISSVESFVETAVSYALDPRWPTFK